MDVRGRLGLSDEVRNGFDAHPGHLQGQGRRAGGEAARGRRARPGALRRLRHGQPRRPGRGRRRHELRLPGGRGRRPGRPPSTENTDMFELTAKTEAGARLVRLAESLAERAGDAGRACTIARRPSRTRASTRSSARATSPPRSPPSYGGLGVTSVHDVVVASSRLARGDASVAIGVNMHLVILMNIVRRWQIAVAAGDQRRAAIFAASMESIARDGVVIAAAISELGQDLTRPRPRRRARPRAGAIDGRKAFCTMSPAATVLYTAVTFLDDDGVERYGYAQVPTDAAGVEIRGDWDALGMRASGSHSITFDGVSSCRAPRCAGGFLAGDTDAYMERNLAAGLFHASASLGHRRERGAAATADRSRPAASPIARARTLLAENVVDLGACRATLARRPTLVDESDRGRCRAVRRDPGGEDLRQRGAPRASSIARWPSPAAPATSTATRSRAPTATSAPAASCTRSAPTAPTTCSATSRSGASSSFTQRSGDPMSAQVEPIVDPGVLRDHIRAMYREVAEQPDGDFHFELGRPVAERLGYPRDWLDAVPPDALASFAGVGHMLDLAAHRARRHGARPRLGLGHRRLRGRAPHGTDGPRDRRRHDRRAAGQGAAPARRARPRPRPSSSRADRGPAGRGRRASTS